MRADGKLDRLADRKAVIEARIAVRRFECMRNATQVMQPLAMISGLVEQWRGLMGSAGARAGEGAGAAAQSAAAGSTVPRR